MDTHANGIGCLAAQYVAKVKTALGGVYMTSPDNTQNYDYRIETRIVEDREVLYITVRHFETLLFQGDVGEFFSVCNMARDGDEPDVKEENPFRKFIEEVEAEVAKEREAKRRPDAKTPQAKQDREELFSYLGHAVIRLSNGNAYKLTNAIMSCRRCGKETSAEEGYAYVTMKAPGKYLVCPACHNLLRNQKEIKKIGSPGHEIRVFPLSDFMPQEEWDKMVKKLLEKYAADLSVLERGEFIPKEEWVEMMKEIREYDALLKEKNKKKRKKQTVKNGKTIQCMYCGVYSSNTNHVCDECEALAKEIDQKQLNKKQREQGETNNEE